MHEGYIKRTIWVAYCPKCDTRSVKTENPPRETLCVGCSTWLKYIEETYIGPEIY